VPLRRERVGRVEREVDPVLHVRVRVRVRVRDRVRVRVGVRVRVRVRDRVRVTFISQRYFQPAEMSQSWIQPSPSVQREAQACE